MAKEAPQKAVETEQQKLGAAVLHGESAFTG